jgi:hypothetical protein
MFPQNQNPQQQSDKKGNSFVMPLMLIRTWATMLYMPLRTRMGRDHLGIVPLIGFGFVFMWAGFARCPTLLWLIAVDAVVLVVERWAQVARRLHGVQEHTEYGGRPWVAVLLFRRNEMLAKQAGEPLIVFLIGTSIYFFSNQPNAAPFFWWGAAAMVAWQTYCQSHFRRIVDQMNNAAMDNEFIRSQTKRRL